MARISLPPTTTVAGTSSGGTTTKAVFTTAGLAADFVGSTSGAYMDIGLTGTIAGASVTANGYVVARAYLEILNNVSQNILCGIGISGGGTPTGPTYYCYETPGGANNSVAFSPSAYVTVSANQTVIIKTFVYEASAGTITVKGASDRALLIAEYWAS